MTIDVNIDIVIGIDVNLDVNIDITRDIKSINLRIKINIIRYKSKLRRYLD